MTIGVFDGVHLGHQELISRIVCKGPNPTVVTFRESPKKVIFQRKGKANEYEGDIFSLKQKLNTFESLGVQQVVLIDFSENFSKLQGREFIDLLEKHGKMSFLAIGSNFRCGYRKDADAENIRKMYEGKGIPTEVVPRVTAGGEPISSSRIRATIVKGNLAEAAALMGRNFELDLSDLKPGSADHPVYDLLSVQRIVPPDGSYPVLLYPGAVKSQANVENGKINLPGILSKDPESLDFLY